MATSAEMLALVDEAIVKLLTDGLQQWSILGRTFTRADLEQLREMRKEFSAEVRASTNGGARGRLATFG